MAQPNIQTVWEVAKAIVAMTIVGTAMYVSGRIALLVLSPTATERATSLAITAFVLLTNSTFLVLGYYFGHANSHRFEDSESSKNGDA